MKKTDSVHVLRAAVLGDREAFGKLVVQYQSRIRRLFLHLTGGDGELSRDLAQDTFIKAWMRIGSFRAAAGFSTWLYRIAYNTFHDHNRVNRLPFVAMDSVDSENVAGPAAPDDRMMDFHRALAVLSDSERTVILLFYIEDKTVGDISKITDMPPGTIKSHLSRGKKKLSSRLRDSGYES
ncbi:MAG: sigma-70 family RNA polymerase sigma factor [Tannerella sp.]|jgi:RNA polymerase sigma-70 factor (ECF subfamily)|nr:sigma-70 family RNA polymerase sigma factor [Tannerella sp.]